MKIKALIRIDCSPWFSEQPMHLHLFNQKARLQQWIGIITFAVWVLDSSAATKNCESALNPSPLLFHGQLG